MRRIGFCLADLKATSLKSVTASRAKNIYRQLWLIKQWDIAFTRHCESCHNPPALFSGAVTAKPQFENRPFDDEGVSCIVCHSIESVNGRGIGGYTMGQPALLQKPDGTKIVEATDQDILNNIDDHKRAMMHYLTKMNDDNSFDQETEQKIGRAEKTYIYISGIIWLVIILLIVGFLFYATIDFASRD
jgi:hypothetical protein